MGRRVSASINGVAASQTFDNLGRVTQVVNPLGTFVNTPLSTVSSRLLSTTRTGGGGVSVNYSYYANIADKRLQTLQNNTSAGTLLSQFDYMYDADGEITNLNKQLGVGTQNSISWGGNSGVMNDTADQLKWFGQSTGGGLGGLFQLSYDNAGNHLLDLNGSYTFNAVNQITNAGYTYDNNGNLIADPSRTYEWDAADRLVAINYPAVPSMRTEFTYDGLGRRVKIVEKGVAAPVITVTLQPPNKQYTLYTSSTVSLTAGTYTLSIAGLNPNGGTNTGLVDAVKLNTLVSNGGFETPVLTGGQTVWNPSGAIWTFSATSGVTRNSSTLMGANIAPEGKQVGAVQNTGTMAEAVSLTAGSYSLTLKGAQATGNNTSQQMRATLQNTAQVVTSTKQFVWDGNTLAEERDASNNVTRRFYPQGEQIAGVSYFYTRDHLGSVREMVDTTGAVRARYDYNPYGTRTKVSGDLDASFGFTGHYYHAPSGLQLALYRAYDAYTGRWISRDPIGEEGGGPNLYAYVGNNPINLLDLLGLRPNSGTFWPAYPDYGTPASDVWSSIGGWLNRTYGPGSNSCAARVSKGLNDGGEPITPTRGVATNRNDDGQRYIISASQLRTYLNRNWGRPDRTINTPAELDALRRSLRPGQAAVGCSAGHAGVIRGGYTDDPYLPYGETDVWILPAP